MTNFRVKTLPRPRSDDSEWLALDLYWHEDLCEIAGKICDWYDSGSGAIVLSGNVGCGKTHIARAIQYWYGRTEVSYFLDKKKSDYCIIANEANLVNDIVDDYGNLGVGNSHACCEPYHSWENANLLILDDIGMVSEYEKATRGRYQEIIWRLLEPRLDELKPVLVTTNLKPEQLEARLGQRATDRLIELLGSKDNLINMWNIPSYRRRNW